MTKAKKATAKQKKRLPAKKPGVVTDLSAGAERLSRYVGNSAAVDEAREAYARADAWARDTEGKPYGGTEK
jgi:hypothetical protein